MYCRFHDTHSLSAEWQMCSACTQGVEDMTLHVRVFCEHAQARSARSTPRADFAATSVWQEPDFGLSGKLAAETNRVNGVVLLHVEPPEAAVPTQRWRLYQVTVRKHWGS